MPTGGKVAAARMMVIRRAQARPGALIKPASTGFEMRLSALYEDVKVVN